MENEKSPFDKYKNPDKSCTYPFTQTMGGYCWSYALHVDGKDGEYKDLLQHCKKCELYKPGEPGETKKF